MEKTVPLVPFQPSINLPRELFNIDDSIGFWPGRATGSGNKPEMFETSSLPVDELIRRIDSLVAISRRRPKDAGERLR